MPKKIDWLYFRKNCNTCKKSAAFRDELGSTVSETVDAAKQKIGPAEALKLLAGVDKLVAARGKAVAEFNLKKDRPDDDALLAHLIGPTGNLRAPTARVGKTLLVGFNEETYAAVLS